jgi:aldehyde dehydrogenase (NAD+)
VQIHQDLVQAFRGGLARPLDWRRRQLLQIARMAQENADAFVGALAQDLGKPKMEALFAEVATVMNKALKSAGASHLANIDSDDLTLSLCVSCRDARVLG